MSFWRKVLGIEDLGDEDVAEQIASAPAPTAAPAPSTPEEHLRRLGDEGVQTPSAEEVLRLVSAVVAAGREARAIDLARRVLAKSPELSEVSLRVAELLAARGDDAGADAILAGLTATVPVRALMLRGEIAERRGDRDAALAWYERVLARNLDYPGARERVDRIREEQQPPGELAGATLMTDGALTRGRYRVLRELGRGGAGTVFAALDTTLARQVALKVYHRRGRLERERLRVEALTPAVLEHPSVIRIFDVDESLGAIAMEWVRGGSVRQELRRGVIPIERVVRWLASALDALEYVHRHGFVHRDLKPSNLLVREDGRIVLTDFGLAAPIGERAEGRAGGGEGTLAYMAPEQRRGAPAEPAADVHAVGVTLREMLAQCTGEVPASLVELAEACMRRDPASRPSLREIRRGLVEGHADD